MQKKEKLVIALILGVFFIKGLFLVATTPLFQGPDEIVHYSTTVYYSLPKSLQPEIRDVPKGEHKSMTEEQENFTDLTEAVELNNNPSSTQKFSENGQFGPNEKKIINNSWNKEFNMSLAPYVTDYPPFYYKTAAIFEKLSKNQNILSRFFLVRIFSVLLGMLVIFLSYKISQTIGLSEKTSILSAAIISFQPMLSATASIVNPDIMLILAFTSFAWGMTLFLRDGSKISNVAIITLSSIAAMLTKGPGIVLIGMISILAIYEIQLRTEISWKKISLAFIALGIFAFLILPSSYREKIIRTDKESVFPSAYASLEKYLVDRTFNEGRLKFTSGSYWGNFGSLATSLDDWALNLIYSIEAISLIGIILVLSGVKRNYLPERRYIFFFLILMFALQFAIRFYDWRVFDINGRALIGTPGRYFLPNVAIHMLTIIIGLGTLLKTERQFNIVLKSFAVIMALIMLYSITNVIIPHYYL